VPWYVISAEFAGAVLLIPGIYTRWVSLYAIPLMIGAAQFWFVGKGFYFTAAGCEFPVVWAIMLLVQALLGDGPYAMKIAALPWDRHWRVRPEDLGAGAHDRGAPGGSR
jgi:putative oxidoreductase